MTGWLNRPATTGGLLALLAVALFGEPWPSTAALLGVLLGLLLVGATGYGLSLRFVLLAQRVFGAARTESVFVFAPFIGAGVAFALVAHTH